MHTLKDKTYLITGSNSGIGKQVTLLLLECGAKVYMVDKNTDEIERIASQHSNQSSYLQFDLSHPEQVSRIFDKAKEEGYLFDGMVYCAGISPLMTLHDFDYTTCLLTYTINLFSFIAMLTYFTNEHYTNNGSSVVGLSSNAAEYGGNRQSIYSSTKSAMNLIAKSCAKELAQRKTRVNTVMPSITNTEMVAELRTQSEAIDLKVKYNQPFGIIDPKELAKTILFLLSDASNTISGTAMRVNNGEAY